VTLSKLKCNNCDRKVYLIPEGYYCSMCGDLEAKDVLDGE